MRKAAVAVVEHPERAPVEVPRTVLINAEDRATLVLALTLLAQECEADAISAVACSQWKLAESFKRRAMLHRGFASELETAREIRG